jgi:hypothetical protein
VGRVPSPRRRFARFFPPTPFALSMSVGIEP